MYRIVSLGAQPALPALTPAQQAEVRAIIELLPDCYTQEVDDCFDGRSSEYRHCGELTERYIWLDDNHPVAQHVQAYIDNQIDYCHEQELIKSPMGIGLIAGAALAGLVIGFVIPKS